MGFMENSVLYFFFKFKGGIHTRKFTYFIFILTGIFMFLFLADTYLTINTNRLLNQVTIDLQSTNQSLNDREALILKVKINGILPTKNNKLIIFADNRYLEFSYDHKNGLFNGVRAGGVETTFNLPNTPDIEMSVFYLYKEDQHPHPLIYAYIETNTERIILKDIFASSKIFTLN